MEAYARELLAGDRAAIAARYHPDGAYFLIDGRKEYASQEEIREKYTGDKWSPPVFFQWSDISVEPITSDAVIVLGTFQWGAQPGRPPLTLSYNALLRRHEDAFRIRIEDEDVDQSSLPSE